MSKKFSNFVQKIFNQLVKPAFYASGGSNWGNFLKSILVLNFSSKFERKKLDLSEKKIGTVIKIEIYVFRGTFDEK